MKKLSFLFAAALLLLLTAIADMVLWFYVCADEGLITFEQRKEKYLSYFPLSLQSAQLLTLITMALLTAAALMFYKTSSVKPLRIVSAVLGFLSALLFMWQVFSLM
jgi:hypothetical protein